MSGQQHIIRRQVLELEFDENLETETIEREVLTLFNKAVLPMYDRFFSAYSNPGEIDQISRLELDLGEISRDNLESELINKIADALDEQLEQLCGTPVFDDPDELAARLGLAPGGLTATEDETTAKLNELTAFFERHQQPQIDEATTFDATSAGNSSVQDEEAEKRRADLIRFFEQQGQTNQDDTPDSEDVFEEEEWEDEEWEPTSVEINYVRPDGMNSGPDEKTPVAKNDLPGEPDAASTELNPEGPVSEAILLSNSNLLHYFMQSGLFPWWAKNSSVTQLRQAVMTLLRQRPEVLKADVESWITHKAMRKRLVAAFPDEYLVKFLELIIPLSESTTAKAVTDLLRILTNRSFASERLRFVFWDELLQNVRFLKQGMTVVPEPLVHAVFSQTETLEAPLGKSVVRAKLLAVIDRLFLLGETLSDWKQLAQLIEQFDGHPVAENWFNAFLDGQARAVQHSKDAGDENELPENSNLRDKPSVPDSDKKSVIDSPLSVDSNVDVILQKLLEKNTARQTEKEALTDENERVPLIPLAIDPFSDSDKLYVRNAGMILLWPFMERFFEKNGLVEESAFVSIHAQEQASWLLQRLVMGPDGELFEPHIPLNKVIVGLQPETTVYAPEPITEEQRFLIDELLSAVIEHVPAWKNLSVEDVRKAYLQREAAFSARDGQWLLQVKRETYDVLLEKLPWPVQLIRLPWLENLIVVEW